MSGLLDDRRVLMTACAATNPGRSRSENQDSFILAELGEGGAVFRGDSSQEEASWPVAMALDEGGWLLMVADGMGGASGGRVASRMAVAAVHDHLSRHWRAERGRSPEHFASHLLRAVEEGNRRIHEQSQMHPDYQGMGTTTTAVGVLDDFLYLAQVGDSRAYLVRDDELHQLTRDQSFVQVMVDSGQLTREEAERSAHRNMILQALGTKPAVDVDLGYQQIRRGDILVVCSDGLFRVVEEDEIARAVVHLEACAACTALVGLANERGGPDNITVIVARFDGDGLQQAQENEPVGRRSFFGDATDPGSGASF